MYDAMLDAAKEGSVGFIKAIGKGNHNLLWAMENHGKRHICACFIDSYNRKSLVWYVERQENSLCIPLRGRRTYSLHLK